jgi:hypothetical protein
MACPNLQELWLTSSALSDFPSLAPLANLKQLTCIYLEHSPLAKSTSKQEYQYQLFKLIPTLAQLDANELTPEDKIKILSYESPVMIA